MKLINSKFNLLGIVIVLCLFGAVSCVDQDFDEPPVGGEDPNITANTTIAELKALHTLGALEYLENDLVITGVINADDASGNFYKTIVLEDETAGINVRIDATELYNDFPTGRRIYVKCKGLYLGDYNGLIQLGGGVDADGDLMAIPEVLMNEYIERGQWGITVEPTVVNINDLNDSYTSRLIKLEGVQFANAFAGTTYADAVNQSTLNLEVEDCDGNVVLLRNSGYASFAAEITPEGKGSIVAIYSVFGTDKQLFIRDTNDVDMTGTRCDGSGGGGGDADLDEGFNGIVDYEPVALNGWTNYVESGATAWIGNSYNGDSYAEANVYNTSESNMIAWLITPGVTLDVDKNLSFNSAGAFTSDGENFSVLIATNFDGANVTGANWTPISGANIADANSEQYEWIASGNVDLSAYTGNTIHVAFKYEGSDNNDDRLYRLDNVEIANQ